MQTPVRSTFNRISGDAPLSRRKRRLWYALNAVEWSRPDVSPGRIIPFRPAQIHYPTPLTPAACSPSRVLSHLFWLSMDAQKIRDTLGALIVADIGCGRGGYAGFFDSAFGGLDAYLGIDIRRHEAWGEVQRDPRYRFLECQAEAVTPTTLSDTTLILSQSALEHFLEDLTFMRTVRAWADGHGRPAMQIHLLPASNMWRQYGPHGFRGYSGRSLSRLIAAAGGSSVAVFTLGGRHSNRVHHKFIRDTLTKQSEDRRGDDAYTTAVRAGIEADTASPTTRIADACFLALIIVHNAALDAAEVVRPS